MSFDAVQSYFTEAGLGDRVVVQAHTSATVELAAEAIGCEPGRIAKTMSFLVGETPVLVVAAGDARVDNAKFKARFAKKASMIPGDRVEALVGHPPGGVCPFAVLPNVVVHLDESLRRFDFVHAAAGSPNGTVGLTIPELEAHSGHSGWVDVCSVRQAAGGEA
jgi:prolyl-tRNA editing enzyme YbaK/EbsC (Cys-tRNA(Pro) deacylase)